MTTTADDALALAAILAKRRERVHDLSGVHYIPDQECAEAAATLRDLAAAAQERDAAVAERDRLAARAQELEAALKLYSCHDGCNECPADERNRVDCGWTARAALSEGGE